MRKIIQAGETIRLYLAYDDIESGAAIDPTALACTVRRPDQTDVVITYPDANFIREQLGSFFLRLTTAQPGTYHYEIEALFGLGDIDIRQGKFDAEPAL